MNKKNPYLFSFDLPFSLIIKLFRKIYNSTKNKETVKPVLMPHYSLFLLFYIAFMIIALL